LDEEGIGSLAARHLSACGMRHFAYLGLDLELSRRREQGYRTHLATQDLTCATRQVSMEVYHHFTPIQTWLVQLPRPLGLLCFNDNLAARVIEFFSEEIPDRLAVLGVDNAPFFADFARVPLSSIDRDESRLGYEAARLLHVQMRGESCPRRVVVVPHAVEVRRSTQTLAHEDPILQAALVVMRERFAEEVHIAEIAKQSGCSRATLQRIFKRELGRSPGQELRRLRLQAAERLLLETNQSLVSIARQTGFQHQTSLVHAFRRERGCSPGRFRRERLHGSES